jgi:hypothetical protein
MPAEWVEDIDLVLEKADDPLTTATPLRFGLRVDTDDETWPDADAEDRIQIPLTATATLAGESVTATAMAIIYNACSEKEPPVVDDPEEPEEPEGPDNGIGMTGLVFHPGHLNSGGVCRPTYTARGSLKNHGSESVTGVEIIARTVTAGEGNVTEHVTVTIEYEDDYELTPSKPLRFAVHVEPDMDWWVSFGKGETIEVTIEAIVPDAEGDAPTATMTVRNQCKGKGSKVKGEDPGAKVKDWSSHPSGGPPGQDKDKGKPDHLKDGPPGKADKQKPDKKPK